MAVSGKELDQARAVTESLLEELGIEAYLFEVEPLEGAWGVRLECAVAEGWQTHYLTVPAGRLLALPQDPEDRRALLSEWEAELGDCRRRQG